jgi:hypothetical protein
MRWIPEKGDMRWILEKRGVLKWITEKGNYETGSGSPFLRGLGYFDTNERTFQTPSKMTNKPYQLV